MSKNQYIKRIKKTIESFDYKFLIFLLISTVLWLSLQFSKTNVQSFNLGMNYILPNNRLFGSQPDQSLVVKLKSKTWNLLSSKKFSEKLDLRLNDKYNQVVSQAELFNLVNNYVDDKYEIISIIPSSISIRLVDPASKKIPVRLKGTVKPKNGYSIIGKLKLIPDSIVIMGVQKDINEIEEWFTAEPLAINLQEDISQLMDLEPNDMSINLSPRQVKIQVKIDRLAEKSFKKKILDSAQDSMYTIPTYALVKLSIPLRDLEKVNENNILIGIENYSPDDTISSYKIEVKQLPKDTKLLQIIPDNVTVYSNK